MKMKIMHLH